MAIAGSEKAKWVSPVELRSGVPVYRDKDLLEDLVRNRKYPTLTAMERNGHKTVWFLSLSNNGRLYQVSFKQNLEQKIFDIYAEEPSVKIERFYYRQIAERVGLEAHQSTLKLPRFGSRELIIEPAVLIKLEVKHDISLEQLLTALHRVTPKVQYRPNRDPHFAGQDSFLFFVEVGEKKPLEIIMVRDQVSYQLITAFFPDVFRQ
jgi:hypothetical protein